MKPDIRQLPERDPAHHVIWYQWVRILLFQQSSQNLLPVIDKHGCHLITVGLLIGAWMDPSLIKTQDLSSRQPQQDRGMRYDDEL